MSKLNQEKLPKHDTILSVKISSTQVVEVLRVIEDSLRENDQIFISTPNPEIVLAAQTDNKLQKALNLSDIAIPDGTGLLWAAKQLKFKYKLQRIPGRVLMKKLFELANRKKYKVFLLGASEEVNKMALVKLGKEYPNVRAMGTGDVKVNGEGRVDELQSHKITESINAFQPHILLVAFGAPKQEKWVANNLKKLNAGVVMVVGGSLDYFAGAVPAVPKILSRRGLEWLWRLITQPSRLPRVFNAVVRFPLLVLKSKS